MTEQTWALVLTFAVSATAGAPVCGPAAEVRGTSAAAVAALLRERGIVDPVAGCPAVIATVSEVEGGLLVVFHDGAGRTAERRASSPEGAAALIEGWAAADVATSLLAPRALPPPTSRPPPPPPPAPTPAPWLTLDTSVELGVAFDGSAWPGASVAACVDVGPFCAGGLARGFFDTSLTGASSDKETGRAGADVYVVVDSRFDAGPLRLRPGALAGFGFLDSRNSPILNQAPSNNVEIVDGGLRVGARITAVLPVGDLGLAFSAGVVLAPLAHTTSFVEENETVAGEPLGMVQLGLGLEARR